MPQASEDLRDLWGGESGVDEGPAIAYLESQGYTLRRDWLWEMPNLDHISTEKELSAAWFLITEWDFGGIINERCARDWKIGQICVLASPEQIERARYLDKQPAPEITIDDDPGGEATDISELFAP